MPAFFSKNRLGDFIFLVIIQYLHNYKPQIRKISASLMEFALSIHIFTVKTASVLTCSEG